MRERPVVVAAVADITVQLEGGAREALGKRISIHEMRPEGNPSFMPHCRAQSKSIREFAAHRMNLVGLSAGGKLRPTCVQLELPVCSLPLRYGSVIASMSHLRRSGIFACDKSLRLGALMDAMVSILALLAG